MKCTECRTENNEQARYCKNCGHALREDRLKDSNETKSDKLLMYYIGIVIFITLFSIIHQQFYYSWFESPLKYVQIVLWIIQNLSFIIIPFAFKNQKMKIVGIVLVGIYCFYNLFQQAGLFHV
jgi:uncharacterized membrane protein YvbJ